MPKKKKTNGMKAKENAAYEGLNKCEGRKEEKKKKERKTYFFLITSTY
jgi:hypothetical protein